MKNKKRLDVLLTEQGLAETRTKAQAVIMSGEVYVDGQKADKPGAMFEDTASIEVRGSACPYVSRGGLKLEKALRNFGVDPTGFVCSDSGASTGGFTDCLLQKGASKVFAIDVGYGQLAWKVRNDPRVVCMERTNIRYVTPEDLGEPLDLSVIDVSFISLKIVLPAIRALLKPTGQVLCLIKPQFEAGKEKVGKKGVVRDPAVHREVLENFLALAKSLNFTLRGLTFSPVKGPEGNIEFLGHLSLAPGNEFQPDVAGLVAQAHETLEGRPGMKRVVMTPNPYRDKNFRTVLLARNRLEQLGVETKICLPFDVDRNFELPRDIRFSNIDEELPKADMLICFGGDGTILHASKAAAYAGIPILGVNIGTMGFMAELESSELHLLDALARDEYEIDRRMMLDVTVQREGETLIKEVCLNDVVVAKGAVARIVHLSVFCDNVQAMNFGGDGLIIATPTGSTAYSLSAGGPMVEPDAKNILITPICAHDIQSRCIVASDQRVVSVKIGKIGRKNAFVSADGGKALRLNTGDVVTVSRSKLETQLVRIKDRSFYDIIANNFKNK